MEFFSGFDPDGPIINWTKRTERHKLLMANPELKLKVDTGKLKQIIPYRSFRCYDDCSIARDMAIKGSDIDGGLVILEKQCSVDSQMLFIKELRNQGFTAYHELEYRKIVEYRRENPPTLEELFESAKSDEISEHIEASLSRILFHTVEEIKEIILRKYDDNVSCFYPPWSMDYDPPLEQISNAYTCGFDIDTKETNNLYLFREGSS